MLVAEDLGLTPGLSSTMEMSSYCGGMLLVELRLAQPDSTFISFQAISPKLIQAQMPPAIALVALVWLKACGELGGHQCANLTTMSGSWFGTWLCSVYYSSSTPYLC